MTAERTPLPPIEGAKKPGPGPGPRRVRATQFAINGRFYSQVPTGVQRYGREIVSALDTLAAGRSVNGALVCPPNARDLPPLRALKTSSGGFARGHAWEQFELPARASRPLINLCNTGPACVARQVVCIHDANVFIRPESYSRAFRWSYRVLLPTLVRRAARIATVSRDAALQLAEHLPIAARDIAVIPNGHEHVFRWNAERSALAARLDGTRPFVLLLGSKARHKNIAFVTEQAEDLDALGLDLVIAGGGAGIFAKTAEVNRRNVIHLGFVSDDDLAWLYGHAFCLAFPSLTEGFGLPIVEAMALGCPVISSDRASMPEICGSAALMAGPEDRAAWQQHFGRLKQTPELRADLQARGREQVKQFSWKRSAGKYLELIENLK